MSEMLRDILHLTFLHHAIDTGSFSLQSGLKVVRIWGFGNVNTPTTNGVYLQLLSASAGSNSSSINYGSNGIPRLDAVVAPAKKYNVQVGRPPPLLSLFRLLHWDIVR